MSTIDAGLHIPRTEQQQHTQLRQPPDSPGIAVGPRLRVERPARRTKQRATARRSEPTRRTALTGRHIVILVENLPVPFDRRPWQIAQTLKREGAAVSVICPRMYDYTRPREAIEGIDIYRYPCREGSTVAGWLCEYALALFWMHWLCLRLFLARGIDVIHACNPPDLLFLVAWPFKVFFGVRFVFDHHDLNPEVYEAKFDRRDAIYAMLVALERLTCRLADVSLATNQSFREIAVHRAGMRRDRIYVVRNAPAPGRLVPGPGRRELRFGREHLVAYLGVMNRQDGLDLLLASIRHVVLERGRSDVAFALIGDGPELPSLRQRAAELGLGSIVHFLGRISDGTKISELLNTASVCVCPDPRNPMNDCSTMTKVVEYMALGKAIVAYDLKETRVSAGDAAVYATGNDPVRFGDLIVELLDDRRRRAQMGHAARRRYETRLCWPRSQEQLRLAYDHALRSRRPIVLPRPGRSS